MTLPYAMHVYIIGVRLPELSIIHYKYECSGNFNTFYWKTINDLIFASKNAISMQVVWWLAPMGRKKSSVILFCLWTVYFTCKLYDFMVLPLKWHCNSTTLA